MPSPPSYRRNSLRIRVGGIPPPVFSKCPRIGLVTFFSFSGFSSTKPSCTASYPSGPAADFFCTTTHGPALITVTGVTEPSAAKICVMPIFLPMIPLIIVNFRLPIADCLSQAHRLPIPIGNWQSEIGNALLPAKGLNLNVHARGQIQLHQRINRLRRRIENVHQPLVRANFELLARLLIDVRRTQHRPLVLDRRQRNWS